jgi:hypothetical protein
MMDGLMFLVLANSMAFHLTGFYTNKNKPVVLPKKNQTCNVYTHDKTGGRALAAILAVLVLDNNHVLFRKNRAVSGLRGKEGD